MRKQLLFLLTILFSLSATQLRAEGNWSDDVSAITPEGDPEEDPEGAVYKITSPQQLAWVAQEVNKGNLTNKVFILMNDIDLKGKEWTPIGNSSNAFTGYFRGDNYTISNLKITQLSSGYAGLFGNTEGDSEQSSEISDLILTDVNVVNISFGTGALIGNSYYTNVKNCHVKGVVSTTCGNPVSVGGLIGYAQHSIVDGSSVNMTFTVTDYTESVDYYSLSIGGIAGSAVGGITIRNSSSAGEIKKGADNWSNNYLSTFYAGGLIGKVTEYYDYVVKNSFSTCSIDLTGFPTQSSTEISVGGLVGYVYSPNEAEKSAKVAFSNSFYKGTITSLADASEVTSNNVGTIAGNGNSKMTFANSFYPASSTAIGDNTPSSMDGLAKIPDDLLSKLNAWVSVNNTNSEYLSWNIEDGSLTLIPEVLPQAGVDYVWNDDVCTLQTKKGMLWFVSQVNEMYNTFAGQTVKLAEGDWDMTGVEWRPIGLSSEPNSPFSGTFDGNNQTVKYRIGTVSQPSNVSYPGFFRYIKNGNVKDVTVEGNLYLKSGNAGIVVAQMQGGTLSGVVSKGVLSGGAVGGIASFVSDAEITDCTNEASIIGKQPLGGIVGSMKKSIIRNSVNNGEVKASAGIAGGIAGSANNSTLNGCLNTVAVSGPMLIGGIVGQLEATLEDGEESMLMNSINKGTVTATYQAGGGIAGAVGNGNGDKKDIMVVNNGNFGEVAAPSGFGYISGIGVFQLSADQNMTLENCFNMGDITTGQSVKASLILRLLTNGSMTLKNCFYKEQEGVSTDMGMRTNDSNENVSPVTADGSWLVQLNQYVEAYNAAHPAGPLAKSWKFDVDNNPVHGLEAPVIEGKTPFNQETTVTITALAGAKIYYTLDGSDPSVDLSASPASINGTLYEESITLNEQKTVKAIAVMEDLVSEVAEKTFLPGNFFAVTVSPNDAAMGSVTVITDATPEEGGLYPEGAKLTLTATPNSGYHFKGWSDGQTANPYELTVAEEVALIANFEKDVVVPPYVPSYYDISFEPNDSVLLSANVTTVEEGYSFVVKAEVAEGYDPSTLVVEYKSGRTGRWKTVEPSTNGTYRIRSVYNDIYVRASVEPIDDPTANAVVEGGNRIYAVRDVVYIDRLVPAEAQVLTIGGRIVRHLHLSSGSNQITGLQPGVYVVRLSDGSCRKVSVR